MSPLDTTLVRRSSGRNLSPLVPSTPRLAEMQPPRDRSDDKAVEISSRTAFLQRFWRGPVNEAMQLRVVTPQCFRPRSNNGRGRRGIQMNRTEELGKSDFETKQ
mmetsp:Transcript_62894/g.185763  ORF Transcript_62894/g.185763 Transcript_62894/m.185763 type:complete len:104 (-) Transcript_62894:42-353(-)